MNNLKTIWMGVLLCSCLSLGLHAQVPAVPDPTPEPPTFTLSPNPGDGSFALDIRSVQESPVRIGIYTHLGSLAWSHDIPGREAEGEHDFNLKSKLQPGVYSLVLRFENSTRVSKMVVR